MGAGLPRMLFFVRRLFFQFARSIAGAALATVAAFGATPDARDLERARAAVVRSALLRAAPSVVTIETLGGAQPLRGGAASRPSPAAAPPAREADFRVADGPTTGVIWSPDGWIVTSSFNFVRNPTIITVLIHDPGSESPRRCVARLVARDLIHRIALLKIESPDLTAAALAPSGECRVGQTAIACGRGFGAAMTPPASAPRQPRHLPAVQVGIVSACGRRNGAALQTDAKTSPANYGGPLLDLDGRMLGVLVPLPGAGDEMAGIEWYDSGIGFAVSRETIERVIDRMRLGESIEPGRLGLRIEDGPEGRCRVVDVAEPSPARRAGIQKGDVVLSLNQKPVGDRAELLRRLSDWGAGETVQLEVQRGDPVERLSKEVTLVRPAEIGRFAEPASQSASQSSEGEDGQPQGLPELEPPDEQPPDGPTPDPAPMPEDEP